MTYFVPLRLARRSLRLCGESYRKTTHRRVAEHAELTQRVEITPLPLSWTAIVYMNKEPNQLSEFRAALQRGAARYEVQLGDNALRRLALYYELVQAWNSRLHLVAPCSAAEFASRHVLESLILARHLHENASLVDVGSGAGKLGWTEGDFIR